MAGANILSWTPVNPTVYDELKQLVWGNDISEEVFLRWTQGFTFSEDEPTALLQRNGGPCAIIAPVQAYILKNLLFKEVNRTEDIDLKKITDAERQELLCTSLYEIMNQVSQGKTSKLIAYCPHPTAKSSSDPDDSGESSNKKPKLFSLDNFHRQLVYTECSPENLVSHIKEYAPMVADDFGVICLLYSVILSTGLDVIKVAVDESGEPLIHPEYGHGGQCLVNLFLLGEATPHVFDGEQDAGGLKLCGVSKRSSIGFLSVLESLSYLEVGWHLKSPEYPIWILASETHLSVIFSKDVEIVHEDKETEIVRIVNSYDTEGNGFINIAFLSDVMAALDLVSEPEEYVDLMKEKLDNEGLGIFLISAFMETFFPRDNNADDPKTFELYHYNGIKGSNDCKKIQYHKAKAILHALPDQTVSTDCSQILKCMQTKWPTLELRWEQNIVPSLN